MFTKCVSCVCLKYDVAIDAVILDFDYFSHFSVHNSLNFTVCRFEHSNNALGIVFGVFTYKNNVKYTEYIPKRLYIFVSKYSMFSCVLMNITQLTCCLYGMDNLIMKNSKQYLAYSPKISDGNGAKNYTSNILMVFTLRHKIAEFNRNN